VFTGRRPEALLYQLHLVAFGAYLRRGWGRHRSRPGRGEPA